jgi:hypothetical protein
MVGRMIGKDEKLDYFLLRQKERSKKHGTHTFTSKVRSKSNAEEKREL